MARHLGWKLPEAQRVTPAVAVAVAGVALSVLVMLLSISIVRGFKLEVQHNILSLHDPITITGYDEYDRPAPFPISEITASLTLPDGAEAVPHIEQAAILKTPDDFLGINLQSASTALADTSLIVSRTQADLLQLSKGQRVPAYFFVDDRLRVRQLTVDSIYTTPIAEHDLITAYASPQMLQPLLGLPDGYTHTLGIKGIDTDEIETVAADLHSQLLNAYYQGQLNQAYGLTDIFQTDAQYFSWLNLLDTNVVVIIALMAAVAAVTLTSSLFVIILERVKTIGLLKALGADNGQIRRIFVLMTERLIMRGLVIGNILALLFIVIQSATHIIPLDPASYYIDHVPAHFSLAAFIITNIAVIAVSYTVLMLPAMTVARISPVTALRYE